MFAPCWPSAGPIGGAGVACPPGVIHGYDNTSSETVDAMAAMYLYYHPDGNVVLTYPFPPPADEAHR